MSETVTAVLAVAAYVVAIAFSLSLFLFAVSRVVSGEQDSGGFGIALAVLAGLWLFFVIGGGFLWFRLLSVGVPEGLLLAARLGGELRRARAISIAKNDLLAAMTLSWWTAGGRFGRHGATRVSSRAPKIPANEADSRLLTSAGTLSVRGKVLSRSQSSL